MRIPEFLYICTTTETNMEAKIHLLVISANEFSKILTEARHQYLSSLFNNYTWHHRNGFKFIVPREEPAEIIEILNINSIPYFYNFEDITL